LVHAAAEYHGNQLTFEQFSALLSDDGAYQVLVAASQSAPDDDDTEDNMQKSMDSDTLLLYILTEMTSVLFSGIIYGWAPMLIIQLRQGRFESLCPSSVNSTNTSGPCPEQSAALSQVFSIAAVTFGVGGLPLGLILDNYGTKVTVILAAVFNVVGFYLFGFGDSPFSFEVTCNEPMNINQ